MKEVTYKIKKSKNAGLNSLSKKISLFGLIGTFGAVVVLTLLALPVISVSSVYADGLDYTVQVRPSLNITLSSSTVSLLLNPSTTPFGKADLNVSVGTNNFSGYKLYINATDNKLVNNAYSNPTYITTLSSSTTESAFPANSWGYRISSLSSGNADDADTSIEDFTGNNFYPFTPSTTTSGTLINSSTTATNDSNVTLTFGSKVNYEKPSGLYSLDFNFKALPIVTTNNIQNLDPTLCTSDPTIVTDSRDGQAYTIARLPWKQFDGSGNLVAEGTKCWMLDNLRLDLTDPAVQARLTSQTTNASDEALGYLINGGGAGRWAESGVSKEWVSGFRVPVVAISGNKVGGGTWNRNDVPTRRYGDGSGMIGAFYNYCAASAGSYCYASGTATGNAEYDICPSGWRLPTGGPDGETQALCSAYKSSSCDTTSAGETSSAVLLVRDALSLLNSGYNSAVENAANIGNGGYFISSTYARDNNDMWYLGFYTTKISQNDAAGRRTTGMSARCVLTEPQS